MSSTFHGATNFNQPLDNWDTSKVEYFSMFLKGATSFNFSLSTFDFSSTVEMNEFVKGAILYQEEMCEFVIPEVAVSENPIEGSGCDIIPCNFRQPCPTDAPTNSPVVPTFWPTLTPSAAPTVEPTNSPTVEPTAARVITGDDSPTALIVTSITSFITLSGLVFVVYFVLKQPKTTAKIDYL